MICNVRLYLQYIERIGDYCETNHIPSLFLSGWTHPESKGPAPVYLITEGIFTMGFFETVNLTDTAGIQRILKKNA